MQTFLKDSAFNSLQDRICLQNSLGGGGANPFSAIHLISQQLFYYKKRYMLCILCHFIPLKPLTLRMDHAKLLNVLTSIPLSHAILPRPVYFAASRPANHAICRYIDSSVYASGTIRICLFIYYIITAYIFTWYNFLDNLWNFHLLNTAHFESSNAYNFLILNKNMDSVDRSFLSLNMRNIWVTK